MDELDDAIDSGGSQDPGTVNAQWAAYWSKELEAAKKWVNEFHEAGNKVEDRYLGMKSGMSASDDGSLNFNVFWSNIQVTLAAIFARPPKPEINRSHLDPNDDVARVASTILKRIFEAQFALPDTSPLLALKDAVQDRFIPGLGQVWIRYDMQTELQDAPELGPGPDGQPQQVEIITNETAPIDYVRWEDFLMSPCRRWEESRWVSPAWPRQFARVSGSQRKTFHRQSADPYRCGSNGFAGCCG